MVSVKRLAVSVPAQLRFISSMRQEKIICRQKSAEFKERSRTIMLSFNNNLRNNANSASLILFDKLRELLDPITEVECWNINNAVIPNAAILSFEQ